MKLQSKVSGKKGLIMSLLMASTLIIGSIGAGAEASAAANKNQQTVKATATKAEVSKKGVFSFAKKFNKKKVRDELKPEATKLLKIYADTLKTGKTKPFDDYINKHMMDSTSTIFVNGRKYNKDTYKHSIKNKRQAIPKGKVTIYSNALKKVTASKLQMEQNYRKGYSATFWYEYKPAGFYESTKMYFIFNLQSNGKYILSQISFY